MEPPLLGSLKPAESRSFPRNPTTTSLDPIGTRRRSGSHGSWNIASNLHFLNGKKDAQSDAPQHRNSLTSNQEYNLAIRQERIWDRPEPAARPLSMASFDGVLPRPSSGVSAAFGWPAEPNLTKPSRLSMLSTNWTDFTGRKPPMSNNASTHSFQSALSPPTHSSQPRLNPAAPTFESSLMKASDASFRGDSVSIHTDTSQTDISFSTADSASGSVLENVPTKESLFSRLSLSRKGSTSKFPISWKKEGGLFSRGKKDHTIAPSEAGGEELENANSESSMFLPSINTTHVDKDKTWKKDSAIAFFSKKKGPASDTGDEADREKDTPMTAVEPQPASSPWLKKDGTGFFSWKPKDHEKEKEKDKDRDAEKEATKRMSMEVTSPATGKRESFFGKRDKDKGKEKEKEKEKEIQGVHEEHEVDETKA